MHVYVYCDVAFLAAISVYATHLSAHQFRCFVIVPLVCTLLLSSCYHLPPHPQVEIHNACPVRIYHGTSVREHTTLFPFPAILPCLRPSIMQLRSTMHVCIIWPGTGSFCARLPTRPLNPGLPSAEHYWYTRTYSMSHGSMSSYAPRYYILLAVSPALFVARSRGHI